MPHFSGGGGLAKIADVTVAGGAVTTLTTGAIGPLVAGKRYRLIANVKSVAASGSVVLYLNGDTTTTNYRNAQVTSGGSGSTASQPIARSFNGAGEVVLFNYEFEVFDGLVWCRGGITSKSGGVNRMINSVNWHISETSVTEWRLTSSTASNLADGTTLKITEAY